MGKGKTEGTRTDQKCYKIKIIYMNRAFFRKYLPEIIGTLLGAAGGFIYWKYVGCLTGTCAIKSNWYRYDPLGCRSGFPGPGRVAGEFNQEEKETGSS